MTRRVPLLLVAALVLAAVPAASEQPAQRVVSLNPSLSETLVALGATAALVGVDEDSARRLPQVAELPTVGGLFNPSLESVLALQPDLVVMVPGVEQRRLAERLEELGIPVLMLPNITLEELLASMLELGRRVGREGQAGERVAAIRRAWQEASRDAAKRPRVPTLLVLQRDPLFLVGGGTWIDAMLEAAGAENLGAALDDGFPRASVEWLIAASPELLLDASEGAPDALAFWSRWPSIPAVAAGRVRTLPGAWIRPGPYIDRSLAGVAERIRGEAEPPRP